MEIYTILSPQEIAGDLASRLKQRRLSQNLTQSGLAARSGVPLGTLKKFEGSGSVSLVSFIRLLLALDEHTGLESLLQANSDDLTLDELVNKPKERMRGRRN